MTQTSILTKEILHHFTGTVPLVPKLNAPAATTPPENSTHLLQQLPRKTQRTCCNNSPGKLNAPAATTPPENSTHLLQQLPRKTQRTCCNNSPGKLNAPAATTPPENSTHLLQQLPRKTQRTWDLPHF